jgi:hypothetical protein
VYLYFVPWVWNNYSIPKPNLLPSSVARTRHPRHAPHPVLYQLFSFPGPPDSSLHIVGPTKPPPLTPRCRAPLPRRPPGRRRRRQRRDALELLLYLRSTTAAAHAPLTCNCVQPLPPLEGQRHHSWAERTPVARCLGAAPSVNRCILHPLPCVKFSFLNYS